jgi:hypothetical protein
LVGLTSPAALFRSESGRRDLLRCLRVVIRYAVDIGLRADDPTLGIRVAMPKIDGFRTWSEDDIVAFEARGEVVPIRSAVRS